MLLPNALSADELASTIAKCLGKKLLKLLKYGHVHVLIFALCRVDSFCENLHAALEAGKG